MNMAVNPLVSLLGGATSQTSAVQIQAGDSTFAQVIQSQNLVSASHSPLLQDMQTGQGDQSLLNAEELANLAAKAGKLLTALESLATSSETGQTELSLEDLAEFFALESGVGENADAQGDDLTSLLGTLNEIKELMRDIIDILPDLMSQAASDEMLLQGTETLSFAAIIEIPMLLRDFALSQQSISQQAAIVGADSTQVQVMRFVQRETQIFTNVDAQSLSLLSEIDGISLPEPNLKEALTLTPQASTIFKVMISSVMQGQKAANQTVEFDSSEAPLALSRNDQPQFEQIEQPQTVQPKPETQISTKFASVLVQQVRQVDIQEGTTRIELSPRGLGSIEVEMRTNSDGSLAIVVRAENDAVLSALREERDLLAAIIGDRTSGSLDFQEYSQDQSNRDAQFNASDSSSGDVDNDAGEIASSVTQIVNGPQLDLVT